MMQGKYVIVSPVRNEENYIERTIKSVINQSVLPQEWVIVNDGSTDRSEEIIRKYCSEYNWIRLINRTDRGFTQVGAGVIEAFFEGLKNIVFNDWEFIVKLDCDLSFEPGFFEALLLKFEQNIHLGITGATCFVFEEGKLAEEKVPEFHPMAASRIYRRACFEDIGGLEVVLGWDTLDLLRAQIKGWETRRFKDCVIIHHRRMSSRKGLWEGKLRIGRTFYILGYHPLFLIARSIYRLKEKPYFIESIGVICGYIQAMVCRLPVIVSTSEKNFLRKQQIKRLFRFK